MRACLNEVYGTPDVLRIAEVAKPVPSAGEVLIKIHATSVNGSDREGLSGKPLYARIGGILKPGNPVLGGDIAGVVESVGSGHTKFAVGDAVFGELADYHGGFAEYVCSDGKLLARKPEGMTFCTAAAIPQAGTIAWNGIVKAGVSEGMRVLINGAGGSGGSFAIQLAKLRGAEVTAVDSEHKLEYMRGLGADVVLDYAQVDFTTAGEEYDVILDLTAQKSAMAHARAVKPGGSYALVGGSMASMFSALFVGGFIRGKTVKVLAVPQNCEDILEIAKLVEKEEIKVSVDRVFKFDDIPDSMRYVDGGKSKGKVVIQVTEE